MSAVVRVSLQDHTYDVHVGRGLLARSGELLRALTRSAKLGIVTDDAIAPHFLKSVQSAHEATGFNSQSCVVTSGETHKTIATVTQIVDAFLPHRWERGTPLLALGGGVIGDMTGFAAATILRGVPFVQIPTTLLSMVDASVGGKTGVNHAAGKNLIGAFHQPILVIADVDTLTTLPRRELISGLAECIKHDIIRDAAHFASLETSIERAAALDLDWLAGLVAHNVAIKARVVEADPFEHGERAHLNFGHTFGHGIERACSYQITHGECVALGMVAASRTATAIGLLDAASRDRIIALIGRAGLPTSGLTVSVDDVLHAMASDKKVANARLRFVLPDRIGHVIIRDDVPDAMVRAAIESLR